MSSSSSSSSLVVFGNLDVLSLGGDDDDDAVVCSVSDIQYIVYMSCVVDVLFSLLVLNERSVAFALLACCLLTLTFPLSLFSVCFSVPLCWTVLYEHFGAETNNRN